MADGSVTLDTSLDTSGLEKALDKLNSLLKKFSGQANASFDDLDDALEKSKQKADGLDIIPNTQGIDDAVRSLDILNARIENQTQLLGHYQDEYVRVSRRYGETSNEALNLQKKILSAEDAIQKMSKRSDSMAASLRKAESAMQSGAGAADDLGKSSRDAGDEMEKSAKGVGTFQVALGSLVAQGLQSAVSAVWNLVDSTRELRTDLSLLSQNASDAGVSVDMIRQKMAQTAAITGETDSAVEALSNLLAAGFDENQLADALDAITGAYVRFPDTMKIENLAESLQETIATGQATGQFAELLDRLGVSTENFNDKLSATENVARRQDLALKELAGSGLAEVAEQYRQNNEALLSGAEAQYNYNMALAEVASVIEPLKSGLLQQMSQLLYENRDAIVVVGEVIYNVLSVVLAAINLIAKLPPQLTMLIGVILLAVTAFFKIKNAIDSNSGAIGKLTSAFSNIDSPMNKVLVTVLALVSAFSLLLYLILAIKDGISGAQGALNSFSNVNIPSVNRSQQPTAQTVTRGYASGTRAAAPGWAWVGENGPELVNFKGGEMVYNATQSAALSGMSGRQTPTIANYYVTIDAKNVQEFNDIVRIAQNERQSYRMGYIGR